MHRGVRELIQWVEEKREEGKVRVNPPASHKEIEALEHQLGTPLPTDLKFILGRFDGASLPSGILLSAQQGPGDTIEAALRGLAESRGVSFLDSELFFPFHRTELGSLLAFDRTAAPTPDTWPIVDYDEETGEVRLVHRTLDGWCRLCVEEWSAPDYEEEFTLDKYLHQGERHARIEPDVSIAHVTVAHAHKRAGHPTRAMESYLKAGRCVPPIVWADWEALKLAALLGHTDRAFEAASRLALRAPPEVWEQRDTRPSLVAILVARVATLYDERATAWLRIFEQLQSQALDDDDRALCAAAKAAVLNLSEVPAPEPPFVSPVQLREDPDEWLRAVSRAYVQGELRDEHLLFDEGLRALAQQRDLTPVLRIRRDF